jgi:hypothetical protein
MAAVSLCESIFKKKFDVKLGDKKEEVKACFKEICCVLEKNRGQ